MYTWIFASQIEEQKISDLDDNQLVKLVRDSNQELFSAVIERYQGKLFAYLYRLIGQKEEAEDLLQDVFIKAFFSKFISLKCKKMNNEGLRNS